MDLGKKLMDLRVGQGISQLEVAEKLGVARQTISRWESGAAMPSADNLLYLARLYQVTVDDLLSDEPLKPAAERNQREPEPARPPESEAARKESSERKIAILCLCAVVIFLAGMLAGILIERSSGGISYLADMVGEEVEIETDLTFHVGW